MDEYQKILVEQRIAELTDTEFDALVARTRPPKLTPQQAATEALRREIRGHQVED